MIRYRNTTKAILLPTLLALVLVVGLFAGNYFGRFNSAAQLRGVLQQMTHIPQN